MNSKQETLEESLRKACGEIAFSVGHKPLIGISGNFREGDCTLARAYYMSVAEAGGVPVIIPPYADAVAVSELVQRLDGLVLSGGADIDPDYIDEACLDCVSVNAERDLPELILLRLAYNRHIPILGICRGIQLLAAALGGKLYQDIKQQHGAGSLEHSQSGERHERSHSVSLAEGSLIRKLMGTASIDVNSFHHQAVKSVPAGFKVTAKAPDGIIEAMEPEGGYRSILGVQWHPECMLPAGDRSMMPVFDWLIAQASSFARAKSVHQNVIVLDSHCDTPMYFDKGAHFMDRDKTVEVEYEYVGEDSPDGSLTFQYNPLVSYPKMVDGLQDASFMVAYLHQGDRDADALKSATAKADRLLTLIEDRIAECSPLVSIARTPQQLRANKFAGVKSVVLGIENGYALGVDLMNVQHFAERGVSYITLCHNGDNDVCDSARGKSEHNGLSAFGRQVVAEMNRCGVMVDLSHASEKSFYDALEFSKLPIICSHSSARALCDHVRNLTDDQMRALASHGGVAQACLYYGFIKKNGEATIADAVRHIVHMVDVMGIDHVGIGSDFDGGGGLKGLEDASALTELTRRLFAEGFTAEQLKQLWGENFLKVWELVRNHCPFCFSA